MTLTLVMIVGCLNLISCSSNKVKFAHVPIECLGQPVFGADIAFTEDDIKTITPEAERKIITRIVILRARIDAQCNAINTHNEIMLD